jgi:hypothetical protein
MPIRRSETLPHEGSLQHFSERIVVRGSLVEKRGKLGFRMAKNAFLCAWPILIGPLA